MMSGNRNEFLRRVSKSLGRQQFPAAPSPFTRPNEVQNAFLSGAAPDELKEVFIRNAKAAGTAVHECALEAVNDTILAAVPQLAAGPIILTDDPFWVERGTVAALKTNEQEVHVWDQAGNREDNIASAEGAAVGMAVARLALAETGTVMLYSEKGCGRSVTLLPTTTLFIVRRESILPRLTQALHLIEEQRQTGLPASINFISGASSTADIELVRVQGVHGPMKIAYIVVS